MHESTEGPEHCAHHTCWSSGPAQPSLKCPVLNPYQRPGRDPAWAARRSESRALVQRCLAQGGWLKRLCTWQSRQSTLPMPGRLPASWFLNNDPTQSWRSTLCMAPGRIAISRTFSPGSQQAKPTGRMNHSPWAGCSALPRRDSAPSTLVWFSLQGSQSSAGRRGPSPLLCRM